MYLAVFIFIVIVSYFGAYLALKNRNYSIGLRIGYIFILGMIPFFILSNIFVSVFVKEDNDAIGASELVVLFWSYMIPYWLGIITLILLFIAFLYKRLIKNGWYNIN